MEIIASTNNFILVDRLSNLLKSRIVKKFSKRKQNQFQRSNPFFAKNLLSTQPDFWLDELDPSVRFLGMLSDRSPTTISRLDFSLVHFN